MTHYTFEQFIEMNQIPEDERFEFCMYCDGEGTHECECGHSHECRHCEGKGKTDLLKQQYDKLCAEDEKKWNEWHKGTLVA